MTVFDTRRSSPGIALGLVLIVVVVLLLVLFIMWEMASEIAFTSTVTTPILPEQIVDSATSPVTTAGR